MSICDFLFSADVVVPSRPVALDALIKEIGLRPPPPGANKYYEGAGWDVTFAGVGPDKAQAPTTLEIMAPFDIPADRLGKPGQRNVGMPVYMAQAPRSWRTHATVIVTSELDSVIARVRESGRRHFYQGPPDMPGFPRIWLGIASADHVDYRAQADCGLRLEFIPRGASSFSVEHVDTTPDTPRPGEAGIRRILSRDFLVEDLDAVLRDLDATFGWQPDHEVREEPGRGYRFASMSRNFPQGAGLRLIQATDPDTKIGREFKSEGPGPYSIVCSVFDLDATAADLEARQTDFTRASAGRHEPEALHVLSPNLGAPFVFVGP